MPITKKRLREIIIEELEASHKNETLSEAVSVPKNILSETIEAFEGFELDESLQSKLDKLKEFLGDKE